MQDLSLNTTKTMSSTEIAELTGKEKSNIHRDIKEQLFFNLYEIDASDLKDGQIQGLTVVLDERGYWKEVLLDKYHTDILVSGYEVKYRAAIVKRWHELEQTTKPKTAGELFMQQAQFMIEQERINAEHDDRLNAIEAKQKVIDRVVHEFTVMAYFNYANLGDLALKESNAIGKKLTKYCKANGYPIGKQPDPRFGYVNSYPEHALVHILKQEGYIPE